MQDLPIKYFDSHNHGDVMSYYTNDIDTLRQMISQSIPQFIVSAVTIITVLSIMLYYSLWMTLVILLGVACMVLVTKKIGGKVLPVFYPHAAVHVASYGGLCGGDDERPEGG